MDTKLTLPIGTQVVTHADVERRAAGAVGVVAALNGADYTVRFADGGAATLPRDALRIRKQHQQPTPSAPQADLTPYIIYRCVVGSRAYGLDDAASDTDLRGIYLPPATLHWSLAGVPEQIERKDSEECYWELQKFIALGLKANPNILECLYTPLVLHAAPLAEELLAMRGAFLSRLVYQTYNGYVMSQFKRLEQDLRTSGAVKWKHAMHLIRLLLSGIATLQAGVVPVQVGAQRERLLAVKRGEWAWAAVNEWRLALHREFDSAFAATALPERPDYARADAFLVRARRAMVDI